jgi:formate hydrogenlyase transcriptional activator
MEANADQITDLQDCINDLVSLTAIPALSAGREPTQFAGTVLDALLGMLRLDFVYARMRSPISAERIEMVRFAASVSLRLPAPELGQLLNTRLGDDSLKWPTRVRDSLGESEFSIVPLRLGLQHEIGAIVAASSRTDFPRVTESLLLNVAVNQTFVALQEGWVLEEQKRIAENLEQKVAERTRELLATVESIPALVAIMAPDGEVDFLNRRALEYFGRTLGELKGWTTGDAVHPDDLPETVAAFTRSLESGDPYEMDHRLRRADGVYRWFHAAARPIRSAEGRILRWYVLLTDIDERKTAEEKVAQQTIELATLLQEIRGSEAELRRVIDTIPTLAWCNLTDGSNEFMNKRWHDYTGRTPAESNGWGWQASFHPEDLPPLMEKWRAALALGEPDEIEARLRRHDGTFRWFLIRVEPLRNEAGEVVRWYGTSTDIEDRKRAEEKLRQNERELRQITDVTSQIIIVEDAQGIPIYANRAVFDYTGLTIDDVTGPDFYPRIFHPEDLERRGDEHMAALSRGLPFEFEQRALRRDGQYRWFLIRYNPFYDEGGRAVRWYATGNDIDDRQRAQERVESENLALREEVNRSWMFEEIVGSSPPLREVLVQVAKVAPTDSTVLISGETGTGKELVARAIHRRSNRSNRAFISVNCGAIPSALIASELFGHEKGAFTGAMARRAGRFEAADGGTIFLDEVGELPMETQTALLRVLQEREFERIGSTEPLKVDVRVVAATNRDLSRAVLSGAFRQDLFYRLNVFPLRLPSLRERADDIPLLVEYLIDRYSKKAGKKFKHIAQSTLDLFQSYNWPGNVRELQNVVERAVILCDSETFAVDQTWLKSATTPKRGSTAAPTLTADEEERQLIEAALAQSKGRISGASGAAAKLGIPRQTLESKIIRLGINKHRFRS